MHSAHSPSNLPPSPALPSAFFPQSPPMLWKILLLVLCAMAAWAVTRPQIRRNGEDDNTQNLALCPKCGVYHSPDAPCQNPPDSNSASS